MNPSHNSSSENQSTKPNHATTPIKAAKTGNSGPGGGAGGTPIKSKANSSGTPQKSKAANSAGSVKNNSVNLSKGNNGGNSGNGNNSDSGAVPTASAPKRPRKTSGPAGSSSSKKQQLASQKSLPQGAPPDQVSRNENIFAYVQLRFQSIF